jgi:GT2 family glycosyltransferase/glycosyltransferase involved in cell wall biosynthesis
VHERNPRGRRARVKPIYHARSLCIDLPDGPGMAWHGYSAQRMGPLLFVSYSGAFGGAERVLLDCAQAVGGQACLACPEGRLAQEARAGGISVMTIPQRRPNLRAGGRDRLLAGARLLAHGRELRALAGDLDARAVVAWGMRSAIAALALPAGTRMAVAHQDLLPGRIAAAAVRAAARRARVVIVPSRTVARDLDPGGRLGERLRIVNPGVALERFAAEHAPATPPEVLVLGALVAWKRPDVALEAVALARRHVPELRLRFVGAPLPGEDGILRDLRDRAARPDIDGHVELAGPAARPELDLARAGCLLHCAPCEPFGLVVAEAMAAGCPVVVPDAGGPTEIVDDESALRYSPGDAPGAARAIVELLSDSPAAVAMGRAGRERARTHLSRERSLAGFRDALTAVGAPAAGEPRSAGAQLTLVTVTHNSERVLGALLDSVERHLPGVRMVVVDSASTDGSLELAQGRAGVSVVAVADNVGFGRACNLGLERVVTPVTALLNPDVELLDDSLLKLVDETLRSDRPLRLLAPLVLSGDGTRQDTVHPAPGSVADLTRALVPPSLIPGAPGVALAPWRAHRPRRVGWAVGCALVAGTSALRELGPFDGSFFMYGEDMELGLRARGRGIETWIWPSARLVHHSAHAARDTFGGEPFELLAQARHAAVARAYGPRRAVVDDLAQVVTFCTRIVFKRAAGRPTARERRQLEALRALRRSGPNT